MVPNIMTLLYADDIIEGSDTVGRLQAMINVLSEFSKSWGLNINLEKTKIIVFRRGGVVKSNEKWFHDGKRIEVVPIITTNTSELFCNQSLIKTSNEIAHHNK